MKHIRADNSSILPYLKPHLLPDDDITMDQMVMNLESALVHTPHNIWLVATLGECLECKGVGYFEETTVSEREGKLVEKIIQRVCPNCKGSSEPQIYGFIIATAPQGYSYVYVNQCWIDQKATELNIPKLYSARLEAWANSLGREKIRMETRRDPRGFARKFGYHAISTIMEKNLNEVPLEENSNGKVIGTVEREHTDQESGSSEQSVDQSDHSKYGGAEREEHEHAEPGSELNREGSDAVQSGDRSEPDPTVRESDADASGVQSASGNGSA